MSDSGTVTESNSQTDQTAAVVPDLRKVVDGPNNIPNTTNEIAENERIVTDSMFTVGDVIRVPTQAGELEVEVDVADLPEDYSEVLDLLKGEYVPLKYWIQFAVAYYRLKKFDQFEKLLEVAASDETINALHESETTNVGPRERIRIQTMLAAFKIRQAQNPALNEVQRAEYFVEADGLLNIAEQIENINSGLHSLSSACKGHATFLKGINVMRHHSNTVAGSAALDLAAKQFHSAKMSMPENEKFLHAELGEAALFFSQGKYEDAERIYRDVIRRAPSCPAGVRVALGFCFDRLGKKELARKAMERALALDPRNEEAMVALAILGSQANQFHNSISASSLSSSFSSRSNKTPREKRRKYKELLVEANVASSRRCRDSMGVELRNAQCLNHLARYISTEWQFPEGGIIKGIMTLTAGSNVAQSSMDLRTILRKGQLIRIGRYSFIIDPKRPIKETEVPLTKSHIGATKQNLVLAYPKLKEAQEFAQMALDNTSCPVIKAEAQYYIGRCFHAAGDLGKAKWHYHEAVSLAGPQRRRAADGSMVKMGPYALAWFGLAQISIKESNLDKAMTRFKQLDHDYPDVPEIMLRIGYIYLMKNKNEQALPFFRRTIELQNKNKSSPGRIIALVMAAEILHRGPRRVQQREALKYYDQVLEFYKDALLKAADTNGAEPASRARLSSNLSDSATSDKAQAFVPPELVLNAAVLHHLLKIFDKASDLYHKTINLCKHFSNVYEGCKTTLISARYNMARLLEDQGKLSEAEQKFMSLVDDHPAYIDGLLRLAVIRGKLQGPAVKRAELLKAQRKTQGWIEMLGMGFQSSFAVNGTNPTVMLGDLAFEQATASGLRDLDKLSEASELYEKVSRFVTPQASMRLVAKWVKKAKGRDPTLGRYKRDINSRVNIVNRRLNHDAYVTVRLANIAWERRLSAVALGDTTKANNELGKYEDALKRCLQQDKANLFAANGLALALVEKDELSAAKEILRSVREASERTDQVRCESAFINLAHVHMLLHEFNNARVEYERVLRRFAPGGTDPCLDQKAHISLLTYTASACNELKEYKDSTKYIECARDITPDDLRLSWMLAETHMKWAQYVIETSHAMDQLESQAGDMTNAMSQLDMSIVLGTKELKQSLSSLRKARELFMMINEHPQKTNVLPDAKVKILEQKIDWCTDSIGVAQEYVKDADEKDKQRQRKRKEAKDAKERRRKADEAAERERKAALAAAEAQLKEKRAQRRAAVAAEHAAEQTRQAAAAAVQDAEGMEQEVDFDSLGNGRAATSAREQKNRKKSANVASKKRQTNAHGNTGKKQTRKRSVSAIGGKRKRPRRKGIDSSESESDSSSSESESSDSSEDNAVAQLKKKDNDAKMDALFGSSESDED